MTTSGVEPLTSVWLQSENVLERRRGVKPTGKAMSQHRTGALKSVVSATESCLCSPPLLQDQQEARATLARHVPNAG